MRCPTETERGYEGYWFEGQWHEPGQTVVAYHNTRLTSLVSSTEVCGEHIGNGILNDGRLMYGVCTHLRNSGVNVYADGGLETFGDSTGWCQLEVDCSQTKRLQGGRGARYCIRGEGGTLCRKVALRALWVPFAEIPWPIFLS